MDDRSGLYEALEAKVLPSPSEADPSSGAAWVLAEQYVRDWLNERLGLQLEPDNLSIQGSSVQVDGFSGDPLVICEIYTRLGPVARTTVAKAITDAAKMAWLRETAYPGARLILAIANNQLERKLTAGEGWVPNLLRHQGVEILNAELTVEQQEQLHQAEERARQGMKRQK